jgi:hypothetical protein
MKLVKLDRQLVVTAGAYTANDVVGGLLTFSEIFSPSEFINLRGVVLTDRSAQSVRYDLVFFDGLPSGTYTNDAAVNPSDADLLLMHPIIALTTNDVFAFGSRNATSLSNFSVPIRTIKVNARDSGRTMYAVLITRGAPTFASTSALHLKLLVEV